MKLIITTLAILLSASLGQAQEVSSFRLTIKNTTPGQPLTSFFVAVHEPGYNLFELGEEASEGLKEQAKDGGIRLLDREVSANSKVVATTRTQGGVRPGQSRSITFRSQDNRLVSMSSMLARTNDGFVATRGFKLPQVKGEVVKTELRVYDAGAEANTESCAHVPAPPCDSHGADTSTNEGFVTVHPGIQNNGDLDPIRDAFSTVAGAVITIEKL